MHEGLQKHPFVKLKKKKKMHLLSSLPQNCLGFIFPVNILYSEDNGIDLASEGPGPPLGISRRGDKLM